MASDPLDARFDRLQQELRHDIQASAAETRRHFEVVAESLRSDIQLVAEGVTALDEKLERFRNEVRQEFSKVAGGFCTWMDRAVTLARQRGERGHEAWALRLLAEIASHHHGPDVATAEEHYGAAMALASELGIRPLIAHCHLGLGKLSRRASKRQEAQEHLTTAGAMYREMDMRFWLEQAEAIMGALQ